MQTSNRTTQLAAPGVIAHEYCSALLCDKNYTQLVSDCEIYTLHCTTNVIKTCSPCCVHSYLLKLWAYLLVHIHGHVAKKARALGHSDTVARIHNKEFAAAKCASGNAAEGCREGKARDTGARAWENNRYHGVRQGAVNVDSFDEVMLHRPRCLKTECHCFCIYFAHQRRAQHPLFSPVSVP
eukprot:scaffold172850_cov18-Tisochrysis_lutea.AAC.1